MIGTIMCSSLHQAPEPLQRPVPPQRDVVQVFLRVGQTTGLQLPYPLPATAGAPYQAGLGEHLEVLRDGLAGYRRPRGQAGGGTGSICGEPEDQPEARPVSEGGE